VQFVTEHLLSLGAYEVERSEYLAQVSRTAHQVVEPARIREALPGWATRF
jgi:Leu/Phe-tRNA-protein transferase